MSKLQAKTEPTWPTEGPDDPHLWDNPPAPSPGVHWPDPTEPDEDLTADLAEHWPTTGPEPEL